MEEIVKSYYSKEYGIKVLDAYDVLNLIFGKDCLLPDATIQDVEIKKWCKQNNARLYSYYPRKAEYIRWEMMNAKTEGKIILVLNPLD